MPSPSFGTDNPFGHSNTGVILVKFVMMSIEVRLGVFGTLFGAGKPDTSVSNADIPYIGDLEAGTQY